MKKFIVIMTALLLSLLLISCTQQSEKNADIQQNKEQQVDDNKTINIEEYVGSYSYDEFLPPNIYLEYSLSIYKENDEYLSTIIIDGYQTYKTVNAKVIPNGKGIDLIYDSTLNEQEHHYADGDVLLKLHINDFGAVITEWKEISSNYDGRYFNKLYDVSGTWNVKEFYELKGNDWDRTFESFEVVIDESKVTSEKFNYSNLSTKNTITSFEVFYKENSIESLKVEPISSGFDINGNYNCTGFYDETKQLLFSACVVSENKCILVDCASKTVYLLEK